MQEAQTPPEEKPIRVTRYQGACATCGTEGIVIESYDPEVMTGLHCAGCILGGHAAKYAPEHPAMRPIVFVARATRGDEPFRTLLESADKQRQDPEVHRAAVARTQRRIEQAKQLETDLYSAIASGKSGRAARRQAEAMERNRKRKARKDAKRAKLPPGR